MKTYNTQINMNKPKYCEIELNQISLSNIKQVDMGLFRMFIRYKTSILYLYNYIPFIMENFVLFDKLNKLNTNIE